MTTPSANTPEDESGTGPVTIGDRVSSEGSPGSNQSKTEPMPPSSAHQEPLVPPELGDMNVGAGDPQAPSHPALTTDGGSYTDAPAGTAPTGLGGSGSPLEAARPTVDTTASTGRAPGPEQPIQESTGTAHRAPGLQGTTPDGEAVETDVDAGAARMGADGVSSDAPGQGDDQGVPSAGTSPSPGSSEEHDVVTGIRLPDAGESSTGPA